MWCAVWMVLGCMDLTPYEIPYSCQQVQVYTHTHTHTRMLTDQNMFPTELYL